MSNDNESNSVPNDNTDKKAMMEAKESINDSERDVSSNGISPNLGDNQNNDDNIGIDKECDVRNDVVRCTTAETSSSTNNQPLSSSTTVTTKMPQTKDSMDTPSDKKLAPANTTLAAVPKETITGTEGTTLSEPRSSLPIPQSTNKNIVAPVKVGTTTIIGVSVSNNLANKSSITTSPIEASIPGSKVIAVSEPIDKNDSSPPHPPNTATSNIDTSEIDQNQEQNQQQGQKQQPQEADIKSSSPPSLIPHPLLNGDMKQIISDILLLLQTYGPLTVYQIEYNLPPYPSIDTNKDNGSLLASSTKSQEEEYRFKTIHDILEVLTVVQVIHKTNIPIQSSTSTSQSTSPKGMEKRTSLSSIPENETNTNTDDISELDKNESTNEETPLQSDEQKIKPREKTVYFFHNGKVRGDVVYPWEIMDMIKDANDEIDETLDRIDLLTKELGAIDSHLDDTNIPKERAPVRSGRKRKVDKMNAADTANYEPLVVAPAIATSIPPSQRMKTTREFMKVLLLKYPDIVYDPVYNAALRNFNVDLGAVERERERYSNILNAAAGAAASTGTSNRSGNPKLKGAKNNSSQDPKKKKKSKKNPSSLATNIKNDDTELSRSEVAGIKEDETKSRNGDEEVRKEETSSLFSIPTKSDNVNVPSTASSDKQQKAAATDKPNAASINMEKSFSTSNDNDDAQVNKTKSTEGNEDQGKQEEPRASNMHNSMDSNGTDFNKGNGSIGVHDTMSATS